MRIRLVLEVRGTGHGDHNQNMNICKDLVTKLPAPSFFFFLFSHRDVHDRSQVTTAKMGMAACSPKRYLLC